jgi:hypothetical protein
MSVGSGISGSFGWSKESVAYGTRVAPAKFIRAKSVNFDYAPNRVQGEGIQSGALGLRGDHLVETHKQSSATVQFDVTTLGTLQLWENLMGPVSTSGAGPYTHVFTLADTYAATNRSLTLQQNVALRTGTDKAKEITGAKATSATISCGIGELLSCEMQFDGSGYSTAQTLASPSYVSGLPWHFGEAVVNLGTFGAEAQVNGVRAFQVNINRPYDTEAFAFGSTTKQQPILNGPTEITGSLEMDYLATADAEDRFTGMTLPSMTIVVTKSTSVFTITVPGVHFEGPAQNNEGYDVPRNTWNWTWKYDGTNLPKITLVSASETTP